MGFGRGKGFTSKVRELMARVLVKGGGGSMTRTETALTDAVTEFKGGGGKATRTESALTETVTLALGSYP